MNVLFLIDKYLPCPSSNGAVASNIINYFKSIGHKVSVITTYDSEGENVFSLKKEYTKVHFFNKLFGYLEDGLLVKEMLDMALRLNNTEHFDVVISFYRPIETVICGLKLNKLLSIEHIAFFLDIPETSFTATWKKKILSKNYARLYKKLYKNCRIFSLKYYKNYFVNVIGADEKIKYVGIPNLKNLTSDDNLKSGEYIDMIYTGSFYEKIRNPEKMLEYLKFIKGSNIRLHLFSRGCEKVVEKYKTYLGNNLVSHGLVSSEEVVTALKSADFLINLSNDVDFQVPGKIVEYISTGKPIINFKFQTKNAGDEEYDKYPLICSICLNDYEPVDKLQRFIYENKGKTVSYDIIEKLYSDSSPKYFAKLVEQTVVK